MKKLIYQLFAENKTKDEITKIEQFIDEYCSDGKDIKEFVFTIEKYRKI